jgi:hypothetical protein
MVDYIETPSGTGIIADLGHVPPDPANRDWQQKLADEASPGIDPDPPLYLAIADAIIEAKKLVNSQAKDLRDNFLPAGPGSDAHFILRREEAIAAAADGTPTPEEYPLLAVEVPWNGEDVEAVAAAVNTANAEIIEQWALIEDVRLTTVGAIEACANQAQVDAILAAIEWPS